MSDGQARVLGLLVLLLLLEAAVQPAVVAFFKTAFSNVKNTTSGS